ncbi:MAG: RNA-binding protein [Nanoarchaeota archaeon]|nr:RNA-binding protein [Nanoarchaeota archaeon]MBU1644639.1 RNA-binding protein [Nanoarchaeota archaeon]MBU1976380.1 RNA-binding protein [Nanoarchaeota archaeon]
MKKTRLKSKEINRFLADYKVNLTKKDQVELWEGEQKIIIVNGVPSFFYYEEKVIPTLRYLQNHLDCLKNITVDMGAIKHIINGADVMRPGIVEIDEGFEKDDFIVIVDKNNQKPLAVGIALLNSEELKKTNSGKVIKNIHYVGDKIWNLP